MNSRDNNVHFRTNHFVKDMKWTRNKKSIAKIIKNAGVALWYCFGEFLLSNENAMFSLKKKKQLLFSGIFSAFYFVLLINVYLNYSILKFSKVGKKSANLIFRWIYEFKELFSIITILANTEQFSFCMRLSARTRITLHMRTNSVFHSHTKQGIFLFVSVDKILY